MRADCIFCGFESYGVDGLKAHSATCNLHPLAAERDQLRADNKRLDKLSEEATEKLHEATIRLLDATVRAEAAESDAAKCREEYKSLYAQVSDVMRERGEAQQLLRELAEILNPHDHYDQAKLLGWARDTVERAREADVAQAHAQDLSRAMEAQPYTSFSFRADGELLCLTKECVRHFPAGSTVANVGHTTDCPEGMKQAALSRTPAQSLARLKAGVLRDEYRKLAKRFREADHRGRPAIVSVTWAVLAESMDLEADRLEATDGL